MIRIPLPFKARNSSVFQNPTVSSPKFSLNPLPNQLQKSFEIKISLKPTLISISYHHITSFHRPKHSNQSWILHNPKAQASNTLLLELWKGTPKGNHPDPHHQKDHVRHLQAFLHSLKDHSLQRQMWLFIPLCFETPFKRKGMRCFKELSILVEDKYCETYLLLLISTLNCTPTLWTWIG